MFWNHCLTAQFCITHHCWFNPPPRFQSDLTRFRLGVMSRQCIFQPTREDLLTPTGIQVDAPGLSQILGSLICRFWGFPTIPCSYQGFYKAVTSGPTSHICVCTHGGVIWGTGHGSTGPTPSSCDLPPSEMAKYVTRSHHKDFSDLQDGHIQSGGRENKPFIFPNAQQFQ